MTTTPIDLRACLQAAEPGPVLTGQLVPLCNVGPLRINYNWLYSALNANPGLTAPFAWVLAKRGTGATISLSPQLGYSGMTLYASVRPDDNGTVQVQAPFSADWITAVGADEVLTLGQTGLMTITLQGLNGRYVAVDATPTSHDGQSGYLLHSAATAVGPASSFFVLVSQVHQNLGIPLACDLDRSAVSTSLSRLGVADAADFTSRLLALST